MEGREPEVRAREELASKVEERERLSEKLKEAEREQERLLREHANAGPAQRATITEELHTLEKDQNQLVKDVEKVNTTIVSLGREVEAGEPVITIPVKEAAKPAGKVAASVQEWKSEWGKLGGGRFLGGSLFDRSLSPPIRSQQISEAIKSVPDASYRNFDDAKTTLTGLGEISKAIDDLVGKKLLADENRNVLKSELQKKAIDLINKGNFEKAEQALPMGAGEEYVTAGVLDAQLNGLAAVFDDIPTLNLDASMSKNLENSVAQRMGREIAEADQEELKFIKAFIEERIDANKYKELKTKLNSLSAREQINAFKKESAERKSGYDLVLASEKLLSQIPAEYKKLAEVAILERFRQNVNAKISEISLDRPFDVQLKDTISEFNKLLSLSRDEHLSLDETSKNKLTDIMAEGLNRFLNDKSIPQEIVNRIEKLGKIAESITRSLNLKENPESAKLIKVVTGQIGSLVTNEIQNHTLVAEAAKGIATKPSAYADAYLKELDLLKRYLDIDNQYGKYDPTLAQSKLDVAKRVQRLSDFIDGQKEIQKSGLKKAFEWVTSPASSALTGVVSLFKGGDGLKQYLTEKAPGFVDREASQKILFAKHELQALPEDLFASIRTDIENVQSRLAATKSPEEFNTLIKQLESLDKKLNEPLFKEGETSYTIKDLLLNEKDISAYNQLSKTLAPSLIKIFDKNLTSMLEGKKGLSEEPTAERQARLSELEEMRDRLLQEAAFKGVEGSSELLTRLNKVIEATREADRARRDQLVNDVKSTVEKAQESGLDEIIEYKAELDKLVNQLESFTHYSSVKGTALKEAMSAYYDAQGWRSVVTLAENYKGLLDNPSQQKVQSAYAGLTQELPAIVSAFDYRQESVFTNRTAIMEKQQNALKKALDLLSEQQVEGGGKKFNLVDLGLAVGDMITLKQLNPDMTEALLNQGFIEKVEGGYRTTMAGNSLADLVNENVSVLRRHEQLADFRKTTGGVPPDLAMSYGDKRIKLAEELKLAWMIPDDQTQALKVKFTEASRDPLKDRYIDLQNSMSKRIDTVEEALQNVSKILGLKPEEVKDPKVLAKTLGWTDQEAADSVAFANKLGINAKSIEELAKKFGVSEEDFKAAQASPAGLAKMIEQLGLPAGTEFNVQNETVRQKLLERLAVIKALQEQIESRPLSGEAKIANINLLGDISDLLKVQREKYGADNIDKYFDALVDVTRTTLNMTPEEAQKYSKTQAIMRLIAAGDGQAAQMLNPKELAAAVPGLVSELGMLTGDGLFTAKAWSYEFWLNVRSKTGFIVKLASPLAAVGTYFLAKMGLNTASQAATVGAAAAGTAAFGPLGGLAAYFMMPSMSFVTEVVSIFSATAAGGALYYVGSQIEPTRAELEAMNQDLLRAGLDPIEMKDGKTWVEASKDWATKFFKSDMAIWTLEAARQKEVLNTKTAFAEESKTNFYKMLGLDANATITEVQAALTAKQAQIESAWNGTRWLATRRYNNAYELFLRSQQDIVTSNLKYLELLNRAAVKALSAPAARSQKAGVAWGWDVVKGGFGDAYRWMRGIKQAPTGGVTLTAEDFGKFRGQVDEFYGRQVTDLNALKKVFEDNADQIKKASPFEDTSYLKTLSSLIDGRVTTLREEYSQGIRTLLTEHGIKNVQIGAGQGPA